MKYIILTWLLSTSLFSMDKCVIKTHRKTKHDVLSFEECLTLAQEKLGMNETYTMTHSTSTSAGGWGTGESITTFENTAEVKKVSFQYRSKKEKIKGTIKL